MQRLSNKPFFFTTLALLILGAISLIWLLGQIIWQPSSLSQLETELVNLDTTIPTVDTQEYPDKSVDTNAESTTSGQPDQVEPAPTDILIDDSSADKRTEDSADAISLNLGEWRELSIQGEEFNQGLLFHEYAEGNTLVANFITEQSKTAKSAIIAIDLVSGAVQTIAELGPRYIAEGHTARLRSARLADQHVVWIENTLMIDPPATRPRLYDVHVSPKMHIYDLNTATEKVVDMPGIVLGDGIHYGEGVVVWKDEIEDIRGFHAYHVAEERFSVVEENSPPGLAFIYPRVCNAEWIIYLSTEPDQEYRAEVILQNLITREKIQLGSIFVSSMSVSTFGKRHKCDGKHVAWVTEDGPSASDYIQIYNLESREQRTLHIPDLSYIQIIELNGNIISTATDPKNSIGYDLTYNAFFDILRAPNMSVSAGPKPIDLVTDEYWVQVQMMPEGPKIMVAPIKRES